MSCLKNDYRYDIAMLRLLCIAIVVYFHAYGMMFANHFSETTRVMYEMKYRFLNQTYLINIAMPMFIFISGFLFGGQLMKSQPKSFIKIIKRKFMRLMVPFFVFTTLFMFTQNAASFRPFYQWTYSHLWFLPMLFWCFVVTWFLRPLILSNRYAVCIPILVFLFGLSLFDKFIPMVIGLHNISTSICWFALGTWFYKHENELLITSASSLTKIIIIALGLIIYFGGMTLFPTPYGQHTIVSTLITIFVIYSLWLLFAWISWKNLKITDFLISISACSFGIYIFHNWLEAHMVSKTAQRLLPLELWAQEHVYLYPFLFATIAFLISFVITWGLLKSKIGRSLIG